MGRVPHYQSHNVARSDRCREQEGRHEHCHSQDIGRGSTRGADTAPLAVVQTGSLRARAASRRASRGGDRACDALHRRYGGRGVALAAAGYGLGTAGAKLALRDGGRAEATVWGFGRKARAVDVALANGMLSHAMDYDDTNTAAIMHASSVVVPTAIAVGGRIGASGLEVLASAVMGYEVAGRLGRQAPGDFQRHGYQATSVLGVFASTIVVARLLKASVDVGVHAMGLAGSMASGLMEYLADGTNAKQLHPGWAAHSGILAVELATAGATGPATVLEGKHGVFNTFVDRTIEPEKVVAGLGESFEVENMSPKPYPACHAVHACVNAFRALLARGELGAHAAAAIEEIICLVPDWYVDLVLEPHAAKAAPRTAYEARFSLPYCLARTAIDGDLGVRSFDPARVADERTRELARRVRYEVRVFEEFPAALPGGVRVRLKEGRTVEHIVTYNRGNPRNPLSQAEFAEKFFDAATAAAPREVVGRIHDAIRDLPRARTLDRFAEAMAAVARRV